MYWLIKKSFISCESFSVLQHHRFSVQRFYFEIIYMQRISVADVSFPCPIMQSQKQDAPAASPVFSCPSAPNAVRACIPLLSDAPA